MSIELTDKTQSIYYCEMGSTKEEEPFGNFMGAVSFDGTEATFLCRFRFYKDDKAFNSADTKKWYEIKSDSLEHMEAHAESFCKKISAIGVWVLRRNGMSTEEMMHSLLNAPFSHTPNQSSSIN